MSSYDTARLYGHALHLDRSLVEHGFSGSEGGSGVVGRRVWGLEGDFEVIRLAEYGLGLLEDCATHDLHIRRQSKQRAGVNKRRGR